MLVQKLITWWTTVNLWQEGHSYCAVSHGVTITTPKWPHRRVPSHINMARCHLVLHHILIACNDYAATKIRWIVSVKPPKKPSILILFAQSDLAITQPNTTWYCIRCCIDKGGIVIYHLITDSQKPAHVAGHVSITAIFWSKLAVLYTDELI